VKHASDIQEIGPYGALRAFMDDLKPREYSLQKQQSLQQQQSQLVMILVDGLPTPQSAESNL